MPGADLNLAALHDAAAFTAEQERLGRIWTVVGVASALPRENDWFRTMLGGRSVFVQRFADGLRGFENRCAHRSFPLRQAERGNGPILCGFHHWRYDAEGVAAGIPNCQDAFGTAPRALGRSLVRLDVACCGDLIFARFPGATQSLEEFLGPAFDVLSQLCATMQGATGLMLPAQANWRLNQWIALDDYHLAAVHPGSFGTKGRYLPRQELNYQRFGMHNAYFLGARSGSMEDWAGVLRAGRRDPVGYRMMHIFPDSTFVASPAVRAFGQSFRYLIILRQIPLAAERSATSITIIRVRPDGATGGLLTRLLEPFEPVRLWMARRSAVSILREDRAVCEALQTQAGQIADDPVYGASEIRVAWFNEVYAAVMRGEAPP